MVYIARYKDISELFNFEISEDSIKVSDACKVYEQYVYEIIPVSILDYSGETYFKILNSYIEFLKGMEFKFRILIRNHKFNIDEYIKENTSSAIKNNDFYDEHMRALKSMIKDEKIYYSSIYLCVVCSKDKIYLVDQSIEKLKSTGIDIIRLSNKYLKNLLYESINKI